MQNASSPKTLGRYELLFMLGQGGMGEVHLARLSGAGGFEKLCIVKTILPQLNSDPQFVDRFHHEARVLVQLNHANIAQVYDMGEVDQTLYMAIEYVPGVDLGRVFDRTVRAGTHVPTPVALLIGQRLAEALGYAHRKVGADGALLGLVHRDISPQNVMVSYEGETKVIDFGLAKSVARSKHTMPSTVLGKLGYMSPEQAKALPLDYRSDIYSAGIVLWELLAGRPLFAGGTVAEMVAMMSNPRIPSLRSIRPDISEALDATVMRALQVEPSMRYARCEDLARALNELMVREGLNAGSEDVGNYVRAMCPEEYAAERKLQSQLSLLRKKGITETVEPRRIDATAIRASNDLDSGAPPMTAAQRALSMATPTPGRISLSDTAPMPAPRLESISTGQIIVPKSRAPAIVLGLLGFAALAGGVVWLTSKSGPVPVVAPAPAPMAAAVDPADEKKPDDDKAAEARGAVEQVEVTGEPYRVLKDGDKYYARIEDKQKMLKEGDSLRLVGGPIEGSKKRDVFADASVLEVKGRLARVLVDDEEGLPPKIFAVLDVSEVPRVRKKKPAAKAAEPALAAANGPNGNDTQRFPAPVPTLPTTPPPEPAPAENAHRLTGEKFDGLRRPSMLNQVNGAPPENAQQNSLNSVVLPPPPPPPPSPAPVAPNAPAALPTLDGSIAIRQGFASQVYVRNNSSQDWKGCEVRLPGNLSTRGVNLRARSQTSLFMASFARGYGPPDQNLARERGRIRCVNADGYVLVLYR